MPTGRTTAKITAQHGACYDRLIRELGEEKAGLYAAANRRAIEEYRRLVREKHIDCGWQECAAVCYSTENGDRMRAEAQAEQNSWSVRSVKGEAGGKELLLLGGAGHRTGGSTGGRYEVLQEAARRFWPDSLETARWSAQDCMTLDQVPYIGKLSSSCADWYVAAGFGKWGMSHSMAAALLLTDLTAGVKNPWEEVYTPRRFGGEAAAALCRNAGCTVKGLAGKRDREKKREQRIFCREREGLSKAEREG